MLKGKSLLFCVCLIIASGSASMMAFGSQEYNFAASAKSCDREKKQGDSCSIAVDQLRPTQLSYGEIEVEQRSKKFAAMSKSKLKDYLAKHTVPVVISPDGGVYVTDHHHLSLAMARAFGPEFTVPAVVLKNWSQEDASDFWRMMQDNSFLYLFDENGEGPQDLTSLPNNLFDLKDDPYRSLAWAVSNNGGYSETEVPHADFLWANFLRSRIDADAIQDNFSAAVDEATKIAHSSAAKKLPGYEKSSQ